MDNHKGVLVCGEIEFLEPPSQTRACDAESADHDAREDPRHGRRDAPQQGHAAQSSSPA